MHRERPAAPAAALLRAIACLAIGASQASGMGAGDSPKDPGRPGAGPWASWPQALLDVRSSLQDPSFPETVRPLLLDRSSRDLERAFPMEWDWALQDGGADFRRWLGPEAGASVDEAMAERAIGELGPEGAGLRGEIDGLRGVEGPEAACRRIALWAKACEVRRAARLAPLAARHLQFVFTKHFNLGGSHYAYTEGQSDAQEERQFEPGASLCLLRMDGMRPAVETLLDDRGGVIRDPAVSWDGGRILFAWKKSDLGDDYHLYEMDVQTRRIRQLTDGLGFADYEGAYLPDGGIVFSSTRCVQTVDCWWTEVSNLYACDPDGRSIRRLGFDQVHTNYPTVLDDGRVIYTRWEYMDRGQIFPQALFHMQPDGTGQTAYYGNNSYFPTSILHARGIPGTGKVAAILSGHHTRQTGKLAVIDTSKGNQEGAGIVELAPERPARAVRIDAYGQDGPLFQYPFPLSEREFLVGLAPHGWAREPLRFGIFHLSADGRRELLVRDPAVSCSQPVLLEPRPAAHRKPSAVDFLKDQGTFYIQDVYDGPGLAGVPRGTVQRIRVVALRHRPAGIRSNRSGGPAGQALICTPPSIGNGAWNVKVVLGDAEVCKDGSVSFTVPARTPVYFQALDAQGRAVQTMRSWATLQPGEAGVCIGCHERKCDAPRQGAGASR